MQFEAWTYWRLLRSGMYKIKGYILQRIALPAAAALLLAAGSLVSCRGEAGEKEPKKPVVLMQVGDSVLTHDMVTAQIPSGLNASDSIRMFDALVEAWVDRNMLVNLAGSQLPDIEKIERMVEQYRHQLLANEYRRVMADDKATGVSDADVKTYYDAHPDLFKLERPLVKGIYLKIDDDAPQLGDVKKWMRSGESSDIDNLENYGLRGAMEYDYFGDTWVDWQTIADHIPYRFEDPDKFLAGTKFFECEEHGSLYMLRVQDYMASGERMPLAFAAPQINERLMESHRGEYDKKLLNSLYNKGVESKSIKPGSYVPLKYRRK